MAKDCLLGCALKRQLSGKLTRELIRQAAAIVRAINLAFEALL